MNHKPTEDQIQAAADNYRHLPTETLVQILKWNRVKEGSLPSHVALERGVTAANRGIERVLVERDDG